MINRWRKQKSVLTIKPLLIAAIAPRFDMAGTKMFWPIDLCNATSTFHQTNVLLKLALSTPRHDNRFFLSFFKPGVITKFLLQVLFPFDQTYGLHLMVVSLWFSDIIAAHKKFDFLSNKLRQRSHKY